MKTTNTKKLLIAIIFAMSAWTTNAQNEGWEWAKGAGGADYDNAMDVITDHAGNVYVTGSFGGPSMMFGNTVLTGSGNSTYFIVKYNSAGDVLWAKTADAEDPAGSSGAGMSIDLEGNIYVTGSYRNSITFGNTTLRGGWRSQPNSSGTDTVWVPIGYQDLFVVKYNSSGNVVWAKNTGLADMNLYGSDISQDPQGNIYVTGTFRSATATFGSTILINTYPGASEIFVVKYSPTGDMLWAKSAAGNFVDDKSYICADAHGNAYLTGTFQSQTLTFDNIVLTNALNDSTTTDLFITRFDHLGNVVWAMRAGDIEGDEGHDIEADADGNIYVTGSFDGESLDIGNVILPGNDICLNAFVLKLDSLGNVIWGQSNGNTFNNSSLGISIDTTGNVYIAGDFARTITIGSFTVTSAGAVDVFVAKYDPTGNVVYVKSAGGPHFEMPSALAIDGNGNAYMVGFFMSESAEFGSHVLTNHGAEGTSDIFIAKVSTPSTAIIPVPALANDINIYPNPFSNEFTVRNSSAKPVQLTLYNSIGKEIISQRLATETTAIKVSNYTGEVYLYKITTGDQTVTGRIIKQ